MLTGTLRLVIAAADRWSAWASREQPSCAGPLTIPGMHPSGPLCVCGATLSMDSSMVSAGPPNASHLGPNSAPPTSTPRPHHSAYSDRQNCIYTAYTLMRGISRHGKLHLVPLGRTRAISPARRVNTRKPGLIPSHGLSQRRDTPAESGTTHQPRPSSTFCPRSLTTAAAPSGKGASHPRPSRAAPPM